MGHRPPVGLTINDTKAGAHHPGLFCPIGGQGGHMGPMKM